MNDVLNPYITIALNLNGLSKVVYFLFDFWAELFDLSDFVPQHRLDDWVGRTSNQDLSDFFDFSVATLENSKQVKDTGQLGVWDFGQII